MYHMIEFVLVLYDDLCWTHNFINSFIYGPIMPFGQSSKPLDSFMSKELSHVICRLSEQLYNFLGNWWITCWKMGLVAFDFLFWNLTFSFIMQECNYFFLNEQTFKWLNEICCLFSWWISLYSIFVNQILKEIFKIIHYHIYTLIN